MKSSATREASLESLLSRMTDRLQEKIDEISLIRRVSDLLVRSESVLDACEKLIDIILQETNCENCSIMLLDGDTFTIKAARGQTDTAFHEIQEGASFKKGEGIAGQAALTQECIVIHDTLEDPRFEIRDSQFIPLRSLLCVPLVDRDTSIGVMNISAPEPYAFDIKKKHILTIIANHAALFLKNLELQEQVAKMHREYERFLRHELNNAMMPVMGYSEMLLNRGKNILDEKLKTYIERIQANLERMSSLLQNMKLLQEFELGRAVLHTAPYSLISILDSVILDMQPFAKTHNVEFDVQKEPVNSKMLLDISLMPGVFQNLIKNAIEHVSGFSHAGDRTVRITVIERKKAVVIRINNQGDILSPLQVRLFFEKFNTDRSVKEGGTGLGTTYAYYVTKAHGGEIAVTSREGEGTTVTLIFNMPPCI